MNRGVAEGLQCVVAVLSASQLGGAYGARRLLRRCASWARAVTVRIAAQVWTPCQDVEGDDVGGSSSPTGYDGGNRRAQETYLSHVRDFERSRRGAARKGYKMS